MMEPMVPGAVFDGVPAEFVRCFVGDRVADMLAVPATHKRSGLVALWRLVNRAGNRLAFHITTDLKQVWGVHWT